MKAGTPHNPPREIHSMMQSVLTIAVLIAVAALTRFRPAPAPAKARKGAAGRPNR
jgi:hypothetical protein